MKDKEKLGIYNVTFNDKKSTPINLTDVEYVEDAVIQEVVAYVKGWHNIKRDKGMGANHIKMHLASDSEGHITLEELLNLGNSLREYLRIFKEPFINDKNKYATSRNYEWENEDGIRFRCIVDNITKEGEGHIPPLSPLGSCIVSFYSDRNLNEKMIFKNPAVREFYESKKLDDVEDYSAVEEIKAEISKSSVEENRDVDTNKNSKRRSGNGS